MQYQHRQRYRVTARTGEKFEGFISTTERTAWRSVTVYKTLVRMMSPGRPGIYEMNPPDEAWFYQPIDPIAEVQGISVIEPLGEPVVARDLPLAYRKDGTWWRDIKAKAIVLPVREEKEGWGT